MSLRICCISAEMTPFAKAGGLADVSGALVKYLHAAGHDIRLFMPGYSSINRDGLERYPVEFLQDVPVRIGAHDYRFSVETVRVPGSAAFIYLIDRDGRYVAFFPPGTKPERMQVMVREALAEPGS